VDDNPNKSAANARSTPAKRDISFSGVMTASYHDGGGRAIWTWQPRFELEGDELILLDEGGYQVGDAYPLSPWQDAPWKWQRGCGGLRKHR